MKINERPLVHSGSSSPHDCVCNLYHICPVIYQSGTVDQELRSSGQK